MVTKRETRLTEKHFSVENNILTLQINLGDYDLTDKTITAAFNPTGFETAPLSSAVVDGDNVVSIPIFASYIQEGVNYIQLYFRWDTTKLETSGVMMWIIDKPIVATEPGQEEQDLMSYYLEQMTLAIAEADRVVDEAGDVRILLDASTGNAQTINDTLSDPLTGTIKLADDKNTELEATIVDAQTAKSNLDTPVTGAIALAEIAEDAITNPTTGAIKLAGDAEDSLQAVIDASQIGDLTTLTTTEKTSLVGAVNEVSDKSTNRYVKAIKTKLAGATHPVCILTQGDSTGNDSTEWFEQLAQWFASKYPAYSKLTRTWSDATQSYSILYYLTNQVGANGEAYITQNGLTGNYVATPSSASNAITGDLDFSIKVNIENAGSNENASLVSKFGGIAGQRGFSWYYRKDLHRMALIWSVDGTNFLPVTYSDVVPYAFGQDIWLRITMDADNGLGGYEIKFYTGSNGSQWTQLGTTITGASPTSIFNSTSELLCVGMNSRSTDVWTGKIYQSVIRNAINGKVIASPNAGLSFPKGSVTFKDTENNTWTVTGAITAGNGSPLLLFLNGSVAGMALSYSLDNTRFTLQTPIEPQLFMINYGHNQSTLTGFRADYESLITKILTKYSDSGIVCVTQNPQLSPRTTAQILTQDTINQLVSLVSAKNNYGLIDAYTSFKLGVLSELVSADGVHPTSLGNDLWANVAKKFMN